MKTVECEATVAYPVKYTLRRGRGGRDPKTILVRDRVPISIPVVDVSAVRQAVSIEQRKQGDKTKFTSRVSLDGKLFGPHSAASVLGDGRWLVSLTDALSFLVASVYSSNEFLRHQSDINGAPWGWHVDDHVVFDALPANVDAIIENGRDFVRAETARIAGSMVFVGDKLYQPLPCPLIQVSHDVGASPRPSFLELADKPSPKKGIVFSPLRNEDAQRYREDFRSGPKVKDFDEIHINLFDEALVGPLNLQERNAEAAVFMLLRGLQNHLPDLSPEGMDALGRLTRMRNAAAIRDPSTPIAIIKELTAFERAGFHCRPEEAEDRLLRRVVDMGREGILRSPASLGVDQTAEPGEDLDGLRI